VQSRITRKWSRSGALRERYSYYNGKLNSYYYSWDESGNLTTVKTYYDGILSGRIYTFINATTVKINAYKRGKYLEYESYEDVSSLPEYVRVDVRTGELVDNI